MIRIIILAAVMCAAAGSTLAQRDYLTDQEVELVRDAQQIDKRIDVLTHAIDRRFAALNINVAAPVFKENPDQWGPQPEGTRQQLLFDIRRILQKAIDDIDNLSERPSSMIIDEPDPKAKKKPEGFNELFPRAVRSLAAAASRYKGPLKHELDAPGDGQEKGSIMNSLDMCEEIMAAVGKLSKPSVEPKKTDH